MNCIKNLLLVLSIPGMLIFDTAAHAEYVFIKDGNILDCRILSDTPSKIKVRLKTGKTRTIVRKNIMRILYTELYMGRVYVQKTDGTGLEVYMVDEDRKAYTFRKKLYKPEEFKIKRSEVLFIARKNPSGLKGEAGTDRIKLSWHPPYNRVKKYKVYIKSRKKDTYTPAGETSSKNFTIKNLKSNSRYYTIVTAIDHDGYESNPSNEFKFNTENIKPEAPTGVRTKTVLSKANTADIMISWDRGKDPDGKVVKYEVFKVFNGKTTKLATTEKLNFTVRGLALKELYTFFVRSIDNHNDRSEESIYAVFGSKYFISVRPLFALPVRDFGLMHKYGFGGLLSFEIKDLFGNNLDTGLEAGAVYFTGKKNIEKSIMLPVLVTIGYRYPITSTILLKPYLRCGLTYNMLYIDENGTDNNNNYAYELQAQLEPIAMGGLALTYFYKNRYAFSIGADYGMIIESGGLYDFVAVSISFGINF